MRASIVSAAFLFLIAPGVSGQFPIGHATPVGGFSAELHCEPVWLGNLDFAYRIEGAPPGGSVLLVVSKVRNDHVVSGVQAYVDLDPTNVVATYTATADASGTAVIPRPLQGPEVLSLVGLDLYAQAGVTVPGSAVLGATQGLLLEVALHPVFAFSNGSNAVSLYDYPAATLTSVPNPGSAVFSTSVFGNGGRDLFLGATTGLYLVDTLALVPTLQLIALGGDWSALAWDRVHDRLFARLPATGTVAIIDGNRASPTFATVVSSIPHVASFLSVSADGRVLALGSAVGQLQRLDVDPSSPNYLQVLPTPPAPVVFAFGTRVDSVQIAPDSRIVTVAVTKVLPAIGSELHRFDAVTGLWIDHNPALPGDQPLTSTTHPNLPPAFAYFPNRAGTGAFVTGLSVARIDFALATPAAVSASGTSLTPPVASFPSLVYVALSPSGRYLIRREFPPIGGGANILAAVNVVTAGVFPFATVGITGALPQTVAAWR